MAIERIEGFGDSFAFLVAVNRYEDSIPPLKTPVADALEVGKILTEKHGFKCEFLLDEQATFEGLKSFLVKISKTVTARDRAIFYFAGHGVPADSTDGPMGYVLPQDAHRSSMDKYLSMSDLAAALDVLSCRHLLVILDCCFAGAFRWSSARDLILAPELVHQERYKWFIRDAAWQVIASAAQDQLALDTVSGHVIGARDTDTAHSPFASALLDGLQGSADRIRADGTGDGVITTTELFLYIEDRFVAPLPGSGLKQTPLLWPMRKHDKGQFVFLVPCRTLDLPANPALDANANPWRGLKPYEASHAELFFGRSRASEALLERASRDRFVIVTGPSGIGKSSLVRAGLLPRIVRDDTAPPVVFRPGSEPFQAVASALRAANAIGDIPGGEIGTARDIFAAWIEAKKDGGRYLLVIDQLEELLTMSLDPASTAEFLTVLAKEFADPASKLCVVCTVRSEFEPRFAQSALGTHWNAARFLVSQMSRAELRRVVEGPANVRVVRFESEALMDRLVDEVVLMPGALPLLSFALSEMYTSYLSRGRMDRTITFADYDALAGGVVGSLQVSANRVFDDMDAGQQREARRVLERLVSIEAGEYTRRRISQEELRTDDDARNELVRSVVKRFDEARLFVTDELDGQPQLELAHDALTLGWARLGDWIREDSSSIVDLRRLTIDAAAWSIAPDQNSDLLWVDASRFAALNRLRTAIYPGLNAQEAAFTKASATREKRISIARRATFILLVFLTLGAMIATGFAWDRTATAVSRQIASQSNLASRDDALSTSILLALAAWSRRDTAEAKAALFQRLMEVGHIRRMIRFDSVRPNVVSLSNDGSYVALGMIDGSVRLMEFQSGKLRATLPRADTSSIVAIESSRAGGTLFTVSKAGLLRELDTSSGAAKVEVKVPAEASTHLGNILATDSVALAISPDSKLVALGAGEIHLFNLVNRTWTTVPGDSSSVVTKIVFNPLSPRMAVVARSNGQVEVWDFVSKSRVAGPFNDHPSRYVVQTFDPSTGRSSAEERTDSSVLAVDFSADGKLIVSGGQDSRVVIRDAEMGAQIGEAISSSGTVSAVAFTGSRVAVLTGEARWFDRDLGRYLERQLPKMGARRMAFDATGARAAFLGDELVLWDWNYLPMASTVSRSDVRGMPDKASDIQLTMTRDAVWLDGGAATLVTTSHDAPLAIWRTAMPGSSYRLPLENKNRNDGGAILASFTNQFVLSHAGSLEFWEYSHNGLSRSLSKHKGGPYGLQDLQFSETGTELIGTSRRGLHVFDRGKATWTTVAIPELIGAETSQLSKYGSVAAFASEKEVRVVDLSGRLLLRVPFAETLAPRIALSSDGDTLAIDKRTSVEIWSVTKASLSSIVETAGSDGIIRDVALSFDGKTLSVWDPGETRGLWDVHTGALQARLRNVDVCCASRWRFDDSSRHIAEIGPSGITVWDLEPTRWADAACAIVGRNLEAHERARYIREIDTSDTCPVEPTATSQDSVVSLVTEE